MQNKIWKSIIGFEGVYQISNEGDVLRVDKNKCLKKNVSSGGYLMVTLNNKQRTKTTSIHRLVAIHFIPNPEHKQCVNHIDGNKKNNKAQNLEWCSHAENVRHAFNNGLNRGYSGSGNGNAKLTNKDVLRVVELRKSGHQIKMIAKTFDVDTDTISRIVNGLKWSHITGLKHHPLHAKS